LRQTQAGNGARLGCHLDARLSPGSRAAKDLKLEKQKNNFFIPAAS
jgi:hypothetical protein